MPFASYRSFIGVAKQSTGYAYLTAAVASGATSIPISNTTVPAASTIFFIDGTNSESVAVSAGGGTQTLTTAATANAHAANCPIYAQLTASLGPVNYIPVTSIDYADDYAQIPDLSIRGSNVEQYGSNQGVGKGMINMGGDVFPDTFGYLLGSMFGAVDFAGGSPNTHTFASMNTAASNGQPTPLLWYDYNGNNTRVYTNAKMSELVIKWDPKTNLTWTGKALSNGSIVVANPTSSFSAIGPQAAWQASATIAGTILPQVLMMDVTFKRQQIDGIFTMQGVQTPYQIFAGALACTGNLSFIIENDTQMTQYLNSTQPTVLMTLTNGTGANQVQVQVQITKANFESGWKYKQTGTAGFVEVGGPFKGIATTTDANTAGGGYSPGRVVLKNAVASGTYQ